MAEQPVDKHLETLIGKNVVIDVQSYYVYVGRLTEYDQHYFVLKNADVHDLRDTPTTREMYVLDTKKYGVRVARKKVVISREQTISFSALDDVLEM